MTSPYTPIVPDTSNDPTLFPIFDGQGFLATKTPIFSTKVATATSGRVRRRQLWSYPKWNFKLSHEVLRDNATSAQLAALVGFFGLHYGMGTAFSFFDTTDNLVTNQQFGTGDGSTKTFQLTRTVGHSALSFVEPIQTVIGTPKVSVGASNVTAFTIAGGLITFTSAPTAAAALTWSGQFAFLCTFDADQLNLTQMMGGLWSQGGLSFTTDKT